MKLCSTYESCFLSNKVSIKTILIKIGLSLVCLSCHTISINFWSLFNGRHYCFLFIERLRWLFSVPISLSFSQLTADSIILSGSQSAELPFWIWWQIKPSKTWNFGDIKSYLKKGQFCPEIPQNKPIFITNNFH